ncbi:MAG: hypothetical protein EBX39_14155 [Actinobacteria bacterium]|nr:hypothetical protein [Actinomycetota bacterium]
MRIGTHEARHRHFEVDASAVGSSPPQPALVHLTGCNEFGVALDERAAAGIGKGTGDALGGRDTKYAFTAVVPQPHRAVLIEHARGQGRARDD